jgi:hypothetical protein
LKDWSNLICVLLSERSYFEKEKVTGCQAFREREGHMSKERTGDF